MEFAGAWLTSSALASILDRTCNGVVAFCMVEQWIFFFKVCGLVRIKLRTRRAV
jgi:hypothetical protein